MRTVVDVDAEHAFWNGGLGKPEPVQRFRYEQRAVWHCACDWVLAGTKDGGVHVDRGDGAGFQSTERSTAATAAEVARAGIRAIAGCPRCHPCAWAGDNDGTVWRVTRVGGAPACKLERTPHATPLARRVVGLSVDGADAQRTAVLALYENGALFRFEVPDHGEREVLLHPGGRPYRWVFTHKREPRAQIWIVGTDGSVARFTRDDEGRCGPLERVGQFRGDASCLATMRDGSGQVEALVYGSERGVGVWWPPDEVGTPDPKAGEREVTLTGMAEIRFVRLIAALDGASTKPKLIAGDARGRIGAWDLAPGVLGRLRSEGSVAEPLRALWPPLPGEMLNVVIGARALHGDVDSPPTSAATDEVAGDRAPSTTTQHAWRRAVFFLRQHAVYQTRLFDTEQLRLHARSRRADDAWKTAAALDACDRRARRLARFVADLEDPTEAVLRTALLEAWAGGPPKEEPFETPDDLVTLGAEVIARARRLPTAACERVARLSRTMVLRRMKQDRDGHMQWMLAAAWVRFLRKHFRLAQTYDDKVLRLQDLLELNRHRAIDALIYASRLRAEGIDVQEAWRLDARPVTIACHTDANGEAVFAVARRDGAIELLDTDPARTRTATDREPDRWCVRPPSQGTNEFRDYSNILVGTRDGWLCAPRSWTPDNKPQQVPAERRPALIEASVQAQARPPNGSDLDVHGVVEVPADADGGMQGGWLLGLRSRERPLAWLAATGAREPTAWTIEIKWAAATVRSSVGRPRQRVLLALPSEGPAGPIVAMGGDDGVLRILRLDPPSAPAVDGQPWLPFAVELGAVVIGRPIRAGMVWSRDRGPLLVIGVGRDDDGEIVALELELGRDRDDKVVVASERERERDSDDKVVVASRVKFRDRLTHPVVAVALDRDGHLGGPAAVVLDRGGRVTWYQLDPGSDGAPDDRRPEDYRGRRLAQHRVIDEGIAMCALRGGDLLVAGLVDGHGEARRVRRAQLAPGSIDVAAAVAACRPFVAGTRHPVANAIALLCAMPHRTGAVRAALIPTRMTEDPLVAIEAIADGLRARPDDRLEFKAVLDYVGERTRNPPDVKSRRQNLRALHGVLGTHNEASLWRAHAKRRAAFSRKIIGPEMLAMASPVDQIVGDDRGGGDPRQVKPEIAADARRWVEDLLFDHDPLVRLVTLQTLRATLAALPRANEPAVRGREGMFPPYRPDPHGDPPPFVTGAAWLIDLLARFLREFSPESDNEASCGIEPWTAIIAIYHLLEIYDDAAMTILHRLATVGVEPAVFRILAERLRGGLRVDRGSTEASGATFGDTRRERRQRVKDAIDHYLPWRTPPSSPGPVSVQADALAEFARRPPETPDRVMARTQASLFAMMTRLGRVKEASELAETSIAELHGAFPRDWLADPIPVVARAGDVPRLFPITRTWAKEHLVPLLASLKKLPAGRTHADVLRDALGSDERVGGRLPLDRLVDPERSAMLAVVAHWRSLVDEPFPRVGQSAGPWQLVKDAPLGAGSPMFIASKDKASVYLAKPFLFRSEEQAAIDQARFELLYEVATEIRISPITSDPNDKTPVKYAARLPFVELVPRGRQTWLMMDYLDGWKQALAIPSAEFARVAASITEAMAALLNRLHRVGLCHNDVVGHNILVDLGNGPPRVALVDLDDVSRHSLIEIRHGATAESRSRYATPRFHTPPGSPSWPRDTLEQRFWYEVRADIANLYAFAGRLVRPHFGAYSNLSLAQRGLTRTPCNDWALEAYRIHLGQAGSVDTGVNGSHDHEDYYLPAQLGADFPQQIELVERFRDASLGRLMIPSAGAPPRGGLRSPPYFLPDVMKRLADAIIEAQHLDDGVWKAALDALTPAYRAGFETAATSAAFLRMALHRLNRTARAAGEPLPFTIVLETLRATSVASLRALLDDLLARLEGA